MKNVSPSRPYPEATIRECIALVQRLARVHHRRTRGRIESDEFVLAGLEALSKAVMRELPPGLSLKLFVWQAARWAMASVHRRVRRRRIRPERLEFESTRLVDHDGRQLPPLLGLDTGSDRPLGLSCPDRAPSSCLDRAIDTQPSPEEMAELNNERRLVREAIEKLPKIERAMIRGHYFADQSVTSIGADLGLNKSGAFRLHHQARRRLAAALRAEDF